MLSNPRICLLLAACLPCLGQTPDWATRPARSVPPHVFEKLSAPDRELFSKLMRAGLEAAWVATTEEGYPQCFINELTALHPGQRMVGRARTIRYLPNRKDLREKLYSAGPQLNYRASEETQPGDILVYDAGGETHATVTGVMTTTRMIVRGGAGVVVDGCMRDIPDLERTPAGVFIKCGHASTVSPVLMSVDYQVPVRIAGVTVVPGDYLIGERHGILVVPASVVDKVLAKALAHDLQEQFQRDQLFHGGSLYGLYPTLNEENQRKFEEFKKRQR